MVVERRKNKKRRDDGVDGSAVADKPSKQEYAVAKWIRNNVPSKKTKFDRNHIVEYFTGTRAVDALLEKSPWSKTIFETRQHVVDFLETMLRHKFFHRAKKIVITEDELIRIKGVKKKGKDVKETKEEKKLSEKEKIKEKEKEKKKEKEKEKEEYNDTKDGEKEEKKDCDDKGKGKELKKKPKVRLEMHMNQCFVDCNDAYVWIYEPIPVYYWFFGTLLVLGAIGVCLFPLWPITVRHGVWYLSIAAAGFLLFILSLIVVRSIVFCIIWVLTFGRHHFWLFPNLVEDVGFFASFWPLYHYEYCGPSSGDKKALKKKKRKKDKDSDAEDGGNSHSEEKSESSSEASKPNSPSARKSDNEKKNQGLDGHEASEEGSESEKSNTGGDFEML
ncbi:translocation protein SEC62 [Phymastichus coffea]|uniref:translocation protein SEC62 n=1 Tax=Phymastichus coffea TaxID=108790 RepID=UPI00273C7CCC|nr:translocation protein SEC62 [Phymastichus coffea]XP_058800374.1 translocation protein SEC62 [Phymastichus coffea]